MNQRLILKIIFFVIIGTYAILLYRAVDNKAPKGHPIDEWQKFELAVRDGAIDKAVARKELPDIIGQIEKLALHYSFAAGTKWVFPVQGYAMKDFSGKEGSSYQPDIIYGTNHKKGYDFFDGDKHGGHPAHDIFILDKDQDCLDDRNHKPVAVVAIVDSLVLSTQTGWVPGNELRGGNVVWLYNPNMQMIFYYAHLDKVMAKPGQFLKAGEAIGTVGRTGQVAWKKDSPTHLHLMILQYQDKQLNPFNYYKILKESVNDHNR